MASVVPAWSKLILSSLFRPIIVLWISKRWTLFESLLSVQIPQTLFHYTRSQTVVSRSSYYHARTSSDCHLEASDNMADTSSTSIMTPQRTSTPHQFLPESQASSIQSWARGVPERPAAPERPPNGYQIDTSTYSPSDPAIQAYLRLKLALLTKLQ